MSSIDNSFMAKGDREPVQVSGTGEARLKSKLRVIAARWRKMIEPEDIGACGIKEAGMKPRSRAHAFRDCAREIEKLLEEEDSR